MLPLTESCCVTKIKLHYANGIILYKQFHYMILTNLCYVDRIVTFH